MDTTFFIQFFGLALFVGCIAYAWRVEGPRAAQQWFLIGYIFAVLLINLLVVANLQLEYNSNMVVFGAAPSLTVMLFPAVFYIAYTIARRYVDPTNLRALGYMMFVTVPWLMLPIDAIGIAQLWWHYPASEGLVVGIPLYIPFAWGVSGAAFAMMIGRIRRIRFRGNGQFFAMIIAAPLVASAVFLLIALVQVIASLLAGLGMVAGYGALGLLLALLPVAVTLNVPRIQKVEESAKASVLKKRK